MTSDVHPSLDEEQAKLFVIDGGPWMSCDECFDHLDEYVELPEDDSTDWVPAMASHLRGCQVCREEAESLLVLLDVDA